MDKQLITTVHHGFFSSVVVVGGWYSERFRFFLHSQRARAAKEAVRWRAEWMLRMEAGECQKIAQH